MKKYALSFFICTTIYATDKEISTIYSQIQPINLGSIPWVEEEEWPLETFHAYLTRCLNYQLNPQALKKRRTVFKVFHRVASLQPQNEHNCLYDLTTAQDLHLFSGPNPGDPYIAQIVNRTKTELGRVFLYGLIGSPRDDVTKLIQRQDTIKQIVLHQDLYTDLSNCYAQLAASENILYSFWAQDGFVAATERHYFSIPFLKRLDTMLNASETALEVRSLTNHGRRAFYISLGIAATAFLPIYGIYKLRNAPLPGFLQSIPEFLQGSAGRVLGAFSSNSNKIVAGTATILAGIYCGLGCPEDYRWAKDNVTLDVCVQKKMMGIAAFFNTLQQLKMVLAAYPLFSEQCNAAKQILSFFNETLTADPDMQQLFDICDTATFKDNASFLSHQGRVLVAFRLMYKVKEKLEKLLLSLGELDAYLSVATLLHEYNDKRVKFCFVSYNTASKSFLHMRQFWNPFIDSNNVIANDVTLGEPNNRNMVITGPNAGGKSTLIKGMAINIILALSLTIAACEEMMLNPPHSIGTTLNVVDNIGKGNSLFKAQVQRAQQMIDLVEKTPPDKCSFVALDEMFNGTSTKESKVAAYSVAKHIGKFDNAMCVLATHYPLLTQLTEQNASFANYKVSVTVDQSGIHYPFTLEKGISHQHIALDILRQEGYACSIVDEALELLHKRTSTVPIVSQN